MQADSESQLPATYVLTLKVNLGSLAQFAHKICRWAEDFQLHESPPPHAEKTTRAGRYVCVAPVTSCIESLQQPSFAQICGQAELVTPDGMPIVWALRKLGHPKQQRVCGPDLMLTVCAQAQQLAIPIGLYGSSAEVVARLRQNLQQRYPSLAIPYAFSPPLRPAGAAAADTELQAIRNSGAKILFVGTGCPKQEIWMAQHREVLPLVMVGVGAAFLFHSDAVRRAPTWMQRSGLEWLFRLLQEPKRLFGRYLRTNLAFLWHTRLLSRHQLQQAAAKPFDTP